MKKIIFGILIISLMGISVYSQTIRITAPRNGEVIQPGNPYFIQWDVVKAAGTEVKINIFRDSISQANFVEQIISPNSGKAKWIISGKFTPGKYQIRIKSSTNNRIKGDSGVFTIKGSTPPPPDPSPGSNNLPKFDPNAGNTLKKKYQPKVDTLVVNPVVVSFKPERAVINYGESVKLYFHYKDTMKAHIYNRTVFNGDLLKNPKYPEYSDYIIVKPGKKSRFELNVSSAFKTITRECYVDVKGGPASPPQPSKPGNTPNAGYFKAVPEVVDFGKGTTLKFKVTNATGIVIKDPKFNVIWSWSGKVSDVVEKSIPAKLVSENTKYFLTASNKTGDYYGYAWARWRSKVEYFKVAQVVPGKIIFAYGYYLAELAKIKRFNTSDNSWNTVKELNCYSTGCKSTTTVDHAPGKYKLVLIGKEGVFESNIVEVK